MGTGTARRDTSHRRGAPLPALTALALVLLLSGCFLVTPLLPAPRIGPTDTVTVLERTMDVGGLRGVSETVVGADSLTVRALTPDDVLVYEEARPLPAGGRELLEEAIADYLAWERSLPGRSRSACSDVPEITVSVEGSLEHESTVQDCEDGTPLEALLQVTEDLEGGLRDALATPATSWRVELLSTGETWELEPGEDRGTMRLSARGASEGDAADVELDGPATLTVLGALNDVQSDPAAIDCPDPSGEIEVVRESAPGLTWTHRVCEGQATATLVETLREH